MTSRFFITKMQRYNGPYIELRQEIEKMADFLMSDLRIALLTNRLIGYWPAASPK